MTKKQNNEKKCNKEKVKDVAYITFGVILWTGVGIALYFPFSALDESIRESKQNKKQQIQQEYLDSIHNRGYVTDSVYNILKQKAK